MKTNRRRRTRKQRRGKKISRRRQRGGDDIKYPPDSINDYVNHVLYINLDSRVDRRKQIERQLQIFNTSKITRIPGILESEYPYIGCLKGHIKALETAKENGWDNVLIVEDDAVWTNVENAYPIFEELVKNPYDVIMLGGTMAEYDKETYRIKRSQSSSSYMVSKHYYDTFINKAKEVLNSFVPGVTEERDVVVDIAVSWPLQAADNWFIVAPPLMIQAPGFSNIEKKHVDYNGFFTK